MMKRSIVIASIVLLVVAGIGYFIRGQQEREEQREAQKVYREVKERLLLLSKEYNKGVEKLSYLKQYEEAKKKIIKKPK
nr:hypothetical protein [uncultured Capnocytophaga sp.]